MKPSLRKPPIHLARRSRGFTLIELMIVLVVVSVLVAVAYPNYTEYTRRAVLTEAANMLIKSKMAMDQYYLNYRNYSKAGNSDGPCTPRSGQSFTVTCAVSQFNYTFVATGKAGTQAEGFTYTINQADERTMSSTLPGWTPSAACWLFKKGVTC